MYNSIHTARHSLHRTSPIRTHQHPGMQLIRDTIYRWSNWSSENENDLPEAIQAGSSKVGWNSGLGNPRACSQAARSSHFWSFLHFPRDANNQVCATSLVRCAPYPGMPGLAGSHPVRKAKKTKEGRGCRRARAGSPGLCPTSWHLAVGTPAVVRSGHKLHVKFPVSGRLVPWL